MAKKKQIVTLPDVKTVTVNAGNLGTNAAIASRTGIKTTYFPSIRSRATDYTLGLDNELNREFVRWNNRLYYFGEEVLIGLEARKTLDTHTGPQRYGSEMYTFLVDVAVARLGITECEIDLILFAPPGLYNEVKPRIVAAFSGANSTRSLQFKSDPAPRQWKVRKTIVYPEGLHIGSAMFLDDEGLRVKTNLMKGNFALLDGGGYTFDRYIFVNGRVDNDMLKDATKRNAGIITHILKPALDAVHRLGGELKNATLYDIDLVMRNGLLTGDFTLTIGSTSTNLQPVMLELFEGFAEYVGRNICDADFNAFEEFSGFAVIGGAYYIIADALNDAYPNKLVNFSLYPHLADIEPVDFDTVGALRYEAFLARAEAEKTGQR